MSDYRPVDCQTYAEFEHAIVKRQRLRISWRDESNLDHLEVVEPVDLETSKGEEFLHARSERGLALRLRLDRITRTDVVSK